MSKAKLKKILSVLEKEELIGLIIDLYDVRKEAKEYLEYWAEPEDGKEVERVKKLIRRQFFTPQDVTRRSPGITTINKYVKDFISLGISSDRVADILIYSAEELSEWLEGRYRRVSYRTTLRKWLNDAKLYVETHELEAVYALRLERLETRVAGIEDAQSRLTPRRFGRRRYY